MDWFDEAKRDRALRQENIEARHRDAEKLFNDLWNTLIAEADRINQKDGNLRLYRNGSPFDRVIGQHLLLENESTSRKRDMHIKLSSNKDQITAAAGLFGSLPSVNLVFSVNLAKDGTLGISYDGAQKSMQEATILILSHFLFPDLYQENK